MLSFAKVSHTSFSVRDAERTAAWWRELFGFKDVDRAEGEGWFGILLVHPETGVVIEFQQHEANQGEEFDPRRTGFDHMGLLVRDRAELDLWQERFEQFGVVHTPVVDKGYGSVLTFKDPDQIQFEMFYREGHP